VQKKLKFVYAYAIFNAIETIINPFIELATLLQVDFLEENLGLTKDSFSNLNIALWTLMGFEFFARIYSTYLIFGFYKRLEFGETLLIEMGERELGKML
jgi:hypothetical protein